MTLFAPLRGLRPPPDRADEVAELPYDVMDRAEAVAMADGRPHSFLHVSRPDIDLPEGAAPDGEEALALAAAAFARLPQMFLMMGSCAVISMITRWTPAFRHASVSSRRARAKQQISEFLISFVIWTIAS